MEKKNSLDERKEERMNMSDEELGMCLKIFGIEGKIPICFGGHTAKNC